jgi:carbamate kinase
LNKLPIIEGSVGKNKVNDLTPTHYYKFYPAQSRYEVVSPEEAMAIIESNRIDVAREEGRSVVWKGGKKIEVPQETGLTRLTGMDDVIPF